MRAIASFSEKQPPSIRRNSTTAPEDDRLHRRTNLSKVMFSTAHATSAFPREEMHEIPPRSILLSPEPIALGSSQAESLRSYFTRVIAVNDLTLNEIRYGKTLAALADKNADLLILRQVTIAFLLHRVNSASPSGAELAALLARMLGRPILRHLIWGTSLEGFSADLTRGCYMWCSHCLRTDSIPYVRMLWETDHVVACPLHRKRLSTTCPCCQRTEPRFGNRDVVHCFHCGSDRRTWHLAGHATDDEVTISERIGRLIAQVTSGDANARCSSSDFVAAFMSPARVNGTHSWLEEMRIRGFSRETFRTWVYGKAAPSLSSVIHLSLSLGIPLLEGWHREPQVTTLQEPPINVQWARSTGRRITVEYKADLVARLSTLAERNPPRAPHKVAAQLGVSFRTLKKLAPEVCSLMVTRHQANKQRIRTAKWDWFIAKVDRYVNECVLEGQRPTWRGISRLFRRPACLRYPLHGAYTKQALRRAAEELRSQNRPVDVRPDDLHRPPSSDPAVADGVNVARSDHCHPIHLPRQGFEITSNTNRVFVGAEP